jgi:hypothetical protein
MMHVHVNSNKLKQHNLSEFLNSSVVQKFEII